MAVAFTSILIPEFLGLPLLVMPVPPGYSGETILPQPSEAARILPIQGGGARTRAMAEAEAAAAGTPVVAPVPLKKGKKEEEEEEGEEEDDGTGSYNATNYTSVNTNIRGSTNTNTTNTTSTNEPVPVPVPENPEPKRPKTFKLMKGFRVRLPEEYKDELMNLDFTEEEQRLFNDYLRFNNPFIIKHIKSSDESKKEFYEFWKLFVEKDGTDGFTLMTKLEGRKIQKYMEDILYAHREYLIQSALRLLRKQDNPKQFDDLTTPSEEKGFLFTEISVPDSTVPAAPAAAADEEEDDDETYVSEDEEEDDEEEDDEEEEEEEKPKVDKNKEFKEISKILNGREGNEVKLTNVLNYLTDEFKGKYPHFKSLMGVIKGSHFDISHPRVELNSFFDLYREERDTLSFGPLLNLLIRIKTESIKDVDLRDNFKEFFRTHIFNDVNGVKYRDRVMAYIEGTY